MAKQKMKVRDKQVQKMTKNGLVEKNLTNQTTVRVSKRAEDVRLYRSRSPDEKVNPEKNLGKKPVKKPEQTVRKKRQKNHAVRKEKEKAALKQSKEKESRLQEEKHADLAESRGDSRKRKTGGTKRPKSKKRLQFQETEKQIVSEESINSNNRYSKETNSVQIGRNNVHGSATARQKKYYQKQNSRTKSKIQFDKTESNAGTINEASVEAVTSAVRKGAVPAVITGAVKKAGKAPVLAADRIYQNKMSELAQEDDGAKMVSDADHVVRSTYRLNQYRKGRSRKRAERKLQSRSRYADSFQTEKTVKEAAVKEKKLRLKALQKKQIQKEFAKKNSVTGGTSAAKGTIDYIKKIGGKVTNFFKEHSKLYASLGVFLLLFMVISTALTSCSSVFVQNAVSYAAAGYMSTDDAIRQADLYYTQKEADLQERINQMRDTEQGYDLYRYNIAPIEHNSFVLMSYLSAKYEVFAFDDVKGELDKLFDLQYKLTQQSANETITETKMVKVGESLGQVVTSAYCSCPICCGIWSGGPTASGVYPVANHTLAVDASNPFVPMGTKVIMNGIEYKVEDTGNFAQYGVQFDVYYDEHSAAQQHGHRTWEAYLADDNGTREVEVKSTRTVDVLNVTLVNNDLESICKNKLNIFNKNLYDAYMEVNGNLQMFASPFKYNWYTCISSNFGYRISPTSGQKQLHQGVDIMSVEGTDIKAGLTGKVKISAYNDSYGNYVVLENSKGYELRYAHMKSRSVSAGQSVLKGDVIGKVGSTGDSTGPHLHMEVLKNGERLNPIYYVETGTEDPPAAIEQCSGSAQRLINEAKKHLGTPYVWGGYSPGGFDCSGFVSYCLTKSGVLNTGHLDCNGLIARCRRIDKSQLQPGDLVFFQGTYNTAPPSHVGIYLGNGEFIHCGDPCTISNLNTSYWLEHWYCGGRW